MFVSFSFVLILLSLSFFLSDFFFFFFTILCLLLGLYFLYRLLLYYFFQSLSFTVSVSFVRSLFLSVSLSRALPVNSDFGFVYASCWLIGFSESACNTRTLPVTLYAFHIYVKYTRVMSVD